MKPGAGQSVLIMSAEFPPGPGGIGSHAENLAIEFSAAGYKVIVHTAARGDFDPNGFDNSQGYEIYRYPANGSIATKSLSILSCVFSNRNARWVITSGKSQLWLLWLVRLLSKAKCMAIIHGHEVLMMSGILRKLYITTLRKYDEIVAVSEFSKTQLVQSGFMGNVMVIPNGVRLNSTHSDSSSSARVEGRLVLITVGSVSLRKGQHNVIEAVPGLLLHFREVEYHIVGMPVDAERVLKRMKELDLAKHVFIHNVVSNYDRDRLIRNSDLFMMLSENQEDGDVEGFGIAVIEANAWGIPAVGSMGTGVEQSIKHGVSGLLVNAKDPSAIRLAVLTIMGGYQKFSKGARSWAEEHNWPAIGRLYINLLTK